MWRHLRFLGFGSLLTLLHTKGGEGAASEMPLPDVADLVNRRSLESSLLFCILRRP